MKKEEIRKRISNRVYPPKKCAKPDCEIEFIPTDARQIYCCRQHQIDSNNDKRKIITSYEVDFAKKVKHNKSILIKILNSPPYKKDGYIHVSILEYEGYSFHTYHSTMKENKSGREVKFSYEYGIMLIDFEKQFYKILKK